MRFLRLSAVVCLAMLGGLVGCGGRSSASAVHLKSANAGELYRDGLPVGVAEARGDGQTDIVVTCETAGEASGCQPVRHVMHVRVLWQQGHVIKKQNLHQSQNAAVHWYVTPVAKTDGSPAASGLIEYHGAGLARVDRDGDEVVVSLEDVTLTATNVVGANMVDRLGATTLRGTLRARQDAQETAVALGEVRATLAAARRTESDARVTVEP